MFEALKLRSPTIPTMTTVSLWTAIPSLIIALLVASYAMGLFGSRNQFDVDGKTVILTGASQGMGKSVAQKLAAKGANLVIVARDTGKLEAAMKEITAAAKYPTQRFKYISADVSKAGEANRILAEVTTWNNGISPDIVWTIAGAALTGFFLEYTPEKLRKQMDLNYWSHADMAYAVLADWLKPETIAAGKERHLVFTSSAIAFWSIAGYGAYAPPKAAIKALADTLFQEVQLYDPNVRIHTVFPGTIDSPGFAEETKTKPEITKILEKDDPVQTEEEVARKSIKGLEDGEFLIVVNWLTYAMRGGAWGGSVRNNWFIDTIVSFIVAIAWLFVSPDLNGKVKKHAKTYGHPSMYGKLA